MSKDFKDQQILNLSHFLGYFTHVTTLGEVKEQVLKYIPVMARPMVMYRDKHPIIWTGVYADIEVGILNFTTFWEGHKIWKNLSCFDIYSVFVKTSGRFFFKFLWPFQKTWTLWKLFWSSARPSKELFKLLKLLA